MTLHQRRQRYSWILSLTLLTACGIYDPTFEYAGLRLQSLSTQEIQQVKDSGLVEANNRFAFKLFDEIAKQSSQSNLMISPASASLALFMAYHAASPETADEMANVMEIQSFKPETLMQSSELLMRKLRKPAEGITLELSNSIWVDKSNPDIQVPQDYIEKMKRHYLSYVGLEDFSDSGFLNKVNQKASQDTHGKIPSVLSELPENTFIILMNALYFKASWKKRFEDHETHDRDFHYLDGRVKQVKMMRDFDDYVYVSPSDDFPFQALSLPYGKDAKVSMTVFLPSYDKSLQDVYVALNKPDALNQLNSRGRMSSGRIIMPKFKMEQKQDLIAPLKSLGIQQLFNRNLNNLPIFSQDPTQDRTYISDAFQKSFIDVSEEGTEAAAVTVILGGASLPSSAPTNEFDMILDKPFFYMIRDNETGQILFMGQVTDPVQ